MNKELDGTEIYKISNNFFSKVKQDIDEFRPYIDKINELTIDTLQQKYDK